MALQAGADFRPPPMLGEAQILFIILVIAALAPSLPIATFVLTSWYRDPMRNELVGGVAGSLHQVGLAIDIDIDTGLAENLFTFGQASKQIADLVASRWRRFGPAFQAVVESDHLHLELDLRFL